MPVAVGDDRSRPALASLWRRPNGRLRAGLAQVVSDEPGRVVAQSIHGPDAVTLTTTGTAMDGRCLIEQRLHGSLPGYARDGVAEHALLWLQRSLIVLKERLEEAPGAGRRPEPDRHAGHRYGPALTAELEALDTALTTSGLVPVNHDEVVEIAVPPDQVWELLTDAGIEHLLRPWTTRATRVAIPGVASDVLVAVHAEDEGKLSVTASQVVEETRPSRIVERNLTSEFELNIVTQLAPTGDGCRLTESLAGSLPEGAGSLSGAGPAAGLLRTRLAAIKYFAEAGVRPARDPRTGFLPPGFDAPEKPALPHVPSPVLLPPPHLPIAVPVHRPRFDDHLPFLPLELPPFGF
ncbi:MAG: SRPBCC family protein [Intrasporangium sp.]|uniref:SRPBCC family protein n=1 Tax=Intrasporangium sp. TaxID=1925024 RepID=UPI003F80D4FA